MKPTILFLISILLFIGIACSQIDSKSEDKSYLNEITETPTVEKKVESCVTINFRYLETSNRLLSPTVRKISVFLDEKAFSEENLKTMFIYLSDKYPEPKILTVTVETNWAQLPLPSDCYGSGISGMNYVDEYNYHQAIFYRRGKNNFFQYNPILKTSNFETVVIEGKAL